jgi:hypothetical protein
VKPVRRVEEEPTVRQNKTYPNHLKTKLYSEVERALKAGMREVILSLPGAGARRRKLVAMHVMGDRVLFFDPELNPELSYAAELGAIGSEVAADDLLPQRRYEGHGMHSIERKFLQELFYDGKAYAMIPVAFKLAV